MKSRYLFLLMILLTSLPAWISCSKEPGEGGRINIHGMVWMREYNDSYTTLISEYAAADQEVYIIYGDDLSYSERIRSSYNGIFEFRYLRPGKYRIFVYSKDSTGTSPSGISPVIREIEVNNKNRNVELPRFNICN